MTLLRSFEKEGLFLFRYRGQVPVVLFLAAIPVIWFGDVPGTFWQCVWTYVGLGVCVLGQLFRAYIVGTTPKGTSGRNREEQVAESLNTKGAYSMVRHPLYVGNFLMWVGIVIYTFNPYYIALVVLAFWLFYERVMYAEERFLERKFGQAYVDWAGNLPAFVPRISTFQRGDVPFSMTTVLRREYSGFLSAATGFFFIDLIRDLKEDFEIDLNATYLKVYAGAIVVTLILRTLKHQTKLLDEDNRS